MTELQFIYEASNGCRGVSSVALPASAVHPLEGLGLLAAHRGSQSCLSSGIAFSFRELHCPRFHIL